MFKNVPNLIFYIKHTHEEKIPIPVYNKSIGKMSTGNFKLYEEIASYGTVCIVYVL